MSILRWTAVAVAGSLAVTWIVYRADMGRSTERVTGASLIASTGYGDVEYVEGGSGPAVLVVHGSGGGFDQGQLIAESFLGDDFRWIAPSRFGYLRSTFHEGATFDEQAHAFAALLDQLGINEVAVVAFSHGGPSALLFAVLHPDRVSSLTLVSCGVTPIEVPDQEAANRRGATLTNIYRYDWLYWSATKLFRRQFMGLMGAGKEVAVSLSPEQRRLADRVIDEMNPVSLRHPGVVFDNHAVLPGDRIAAIRAPTLIIHATDDLLQLYENAAFAAAWIPDARLLSFDHGGHLLMVVEQGTIHRAVQGHIREYSR